jgi:hypothetical protein
MIPEITPEDIGNVHYCIGEKCEHFSRREKDAAEYRHVCLGANAWLPIVPTQAVCHLWAQVIVKDRAELNALV